MAKTQPPVPLLLLNFFFVIWKFQELIERDGHKLTQVWTQIYFKQNDNMKIRVSLIITLTRTSGLSDTGLLNDCEGQIRNGRCCRGQSGVAAAPGAAKSHERSHKDVIINLTATLKIY